MALEATIGTSLITHAGLTELGESLLPHAEDMETAALAIPEDQTEVAGALTGTVRITSEPTLFNRLLLPAIPDLTNRYPGLSIGFIPDGRDLNLTGREVDLALRLARADTGGTAIATRKLGHLHFGIYANPDAVIGR